MLYNGNFIYAFSGHSHRAGFYVMTECHNRTVKVKGHPIVETKVTTSGKLNGGKARLIVGASGGPIPGQNYYGDDKGKGLSKWTLERPAGNVMNFVQDTLCLKPATLPTARPRFAVALSFFNDLNEPVFKTFESGTGVTQNETEFKIVLHEDLPGEQFIEGMTMHVYVEEWESIAIGITSSGAKQIKAVIGDLDPDQFKNVVLKRRSSNLDPKHFLSVTFLKKDDPLSRLPKKTGYTQYNYDSPWILPITIRSKQEIEADKVERSFAAKTSPDLRYKLNQYVNKVAGYRIQASNKAPDFKWYRDNFPNYSSGQNLPKGADQGIDKSAKPGA